MLITLLCSQEVIQAIMQFKLRFSTLKWAILYNKSYLKFVLILNYWNMSIFFTSLRWGVEILLPSFLSVETLQRWINRYFHQFITNFSALFSTTQLNKLINYNYTFDQSNSTTLLNVRYKLKCDYQCQKTNMVTIRWLWNIKFWFVKL
jgi:hypothetical protein